MAEKYTSSELKSWLFDKAFQAASPAMKKQAQLDEAEGAQLGTKTNKKPKVSTNARKLLLDDLQRSRSHTMVGKLYFFKYDPKTKDKLWQYDRFPMAFAIEQYQDGFLGINLHYLTPIFRASLLNQLRKFENGGKDPRLDINYDVLMGSTRLRGLSKVCIKRYLYSNCKSKFIEVFPSEYDKAIQLPVEDWVFKR
jgi:hypothetical protein